MMPGQTTHAPMAPHGAAPAQSPMIAMLMQRAQAASGPPQHHGMGGMPQAPGAPMPLNAGGHAAARFGHAPTAMPGM